MVESGMAKSEPEWLTDTIEAAAKEAFWTDDIGGHHKAGRSPHTWENIPEIGRENYRTLIRAVVRIIEAGLREQIASEIHDMRPADVIGSLGHSFALFKAVRNAAADRARATS